MEANIRRDPPRCRRSCRCPPPPPVPPNDEAHLLAGLGRLHVMKSLPAPPIRCSGYCGASVWTCQSQAPSQPSWSLDLPAASAFTAFVVRGLPPIPQSPLLTSSITTRVY